ncbi:MAG: hypothetical protein AMQ22_00230 [Candidatus Methanofastidiosum methylothiophilum]|uniref:Calcineurin-like phosphoesterase domain-containing protein n=1 Tax=Candidatus Methanofastidiosum methylothiophilum TaxID=1705564 RepID=A0A150J8L2_9EURY|nr:MAG: hypothetical protein APG11_00813 [Candidatus Methanofastidiosum methylthiophilus]KYC53559.1 MAG: hypothetical protein AMQ22_00230 [Candidatus Methanofastidiosum methylthiophilus]
MEKLRDDLIESIIEEKENGVTWGEIAKEIGISPNSIRFQVYKYKKRKRFVQESGFIMSTVDTTPKVEFPEKFREGVEWNYKKWFELIKHYREVNGEALKIETVKSAVVKTRSKWIMLVFSGDWHLGSYYVDPDKVDKVLDGIIEHKDAYIITVGDLADNFRRFRSTEAIFSQIPPNDQLKIVRSLIERLVATGKLLATTWGNHDIAFDETLSGYSPIKELLKEKTTFFDGLGKLNLRVNDVEYKIGLTHSYKGSSIYNPNHEHIRFLKEQFPDVDIMAMGHRHFPASNWFPIFKSGENPIPYMIRCGSPKDCPHSSRYYGRAINGNHYFLLSSEKKKLLWLNDLTIEFEDIIKIFKSLNN